MISKEREILLKSKPIIDSIKNEAKHELNHQRIQERYRGWKLREKIKVCLKILLA